MIHKVGHDTGEAEDMTAGCDLWAQWWALQRDWTLEHLVDEHFYLQIH